jgi:hypothetical protein
LLRSSLLASRRNGEACYFVLETGRIRRHLKKGRSPVPSNEKSERPKKAEVREVSRAETIARKLAKVAPEEDPAHVAGAIAIFATETIKRSANNLMEARAYLDGLKNGIDGLLKNAFADEGDKRQDNKDEKKDQS